MEIAVFVKERRKTLKLTQPELASKAGVGLRFVRELEQGKNTLRMDKVNQVLQLFGYELGPIPSERPIIVSPGTGELKITGYAPSIEITKKSK